MARLVVLSIGLTGSGGSSVAVGRRPQFFFLQSERHPDGLSWEIPTVVSTTSTGDSDQPYSTWNRGSPGPPLTQRCPLAPARGGTPAPGTPLPSQKQFRGLQTTRPEKWAPCLFHTQGKQ